MENKVYFILEAIRNNLRYLGFNNIEANQFMDKDGYYIYFNQSISRHDIYMGHNHLVKDIVEPIFDSFKNSPFIADLKASHQKEIDSLKEDIKRLEKLNMNLSEGLSNGAEYLELHADGVKVVKE